jgi:hypothetical protein
MIAVLLVSWSVALPDGGGVSFKGGASFETTSEALSEVNNKNMGLELPF